MQSVQIPNKDTFLSWTDSLSVQEAKLVYYNKLAEEKSWNPKIELMRFAYQNVFLVLWACVNFVKESFNFQFKLFKERPQQLFLHPFSHQCLTISSYSYKLLLLSSLNEVPLYSTSKTFKSFSDRVSRGELEFCAYMNWKFPAYEFRHAFNTANGQKKFGCYSIDLYSPVTKEAYFYQGCWTHCHVYPDCKDKKRCDITIDTASNQNSLRSYHEARARDDILINTLLTKSDKAVTKVQFIYECEWNIFKQTSEYKDFAKLNVDLLSRPLQRLEPAISSRGGLLEVYNLHWSIKENPKEKFQFLDLNSLYTYISISNKFAYGKPEVLVGEALNNISVRKDGIYFKNQLVEAGFIFCQILPPSNLKIPFLQYRISNKNNQHVVLGLCKKCCEQQKTKCLHRTLKSKAFISTYTVPEINFAIKHLQYTVTMIYECHVFLSCDYILKDFFSKMASLRLENQYDQSISKSEYCTQINSSLSLPENFKLDPQKVCHNVMKQNIIKLSLNSIIGKFSENQVNNRQNFIVNSQKDLEEKSRYRKIHSLEQLNDYSVLLSIDSPPRHPKRNVNIYIGSHISAFARIYLYQNILKFNALQYKLFYIDTDSAAFSAPINAPPLKNIGPLLGDFKHVLGPNSKITEFYSLGQRNYSFVFENEKGEIEFLVKCKGLCLKNVFSRKCLSPSIYHSFISKFLSNEIVKLNLKQVRYRQKSHVTPKVAIEQNYSFSNKINIKRIILHSGDTLPYGYKEK